MCGEQAPVSGIRRIMIEEAGSEHSTAATEERKIGMKKSIDGLVETVEKKMSGCMQRSLKGRSVVIA